MLDISSHEIVAAQDSPPAVAWLTGTQVLLLDPQDRVELPYRISTNYGVSSANLNVQINGRSPRIVPLAMGGVELQKLGSLTLRLPDWNVGLCDVVELKLIAKEVSGQHAAGDPVFILVTPWSVGMEQMTAAQELQAATIVSETLVDELSAAHLEQEQTVASAAANAGHRRTDARQRCASISLCRISSEPSLTLSGQICAMH